MPEKVVDLLNAITALKGEAFAEGLVAGVNLVTSEKKAEEAKKEG